jgi:hypothetical protein
MRPAPAFESHPVPTGAMQSAMQSKAPASGFFLLSAFSFTRPLPLSLSLSSLFFLLSFFLLRAVPLGEKDKDK